MKRLFILCGLLVLVVSVGRAQSDVAWTLLGQVNAARAQSDVAPLAMNPQLVQAAQTHSDDMAAMDRLTHTGSDGSEFWDRLESAGYPMTTGAENVLYRFDTDGIGAFSQWQQSPPHNANMMNPAYQEIGVAISQSQASGRVYFTMVLASREDFVPPTATPVIPTDVIPSLTATSVPPSQTPLPTITPRQSNPAAATFTPRPVITFTPQPTATPLPPTATFAPTLTPSPTWFTSTPFPTDVWPTATATPEPDYEVRLFFDEATFTLQNVAPRPLYLEGFEFVSDNGQFNWERWDTEFLTAPLTAFPADDCLQIWSINTTSPYPIPDDCESRHAWATVNDAGLFWLGVDTFDVYIWGERVTRCWLEDGQCLFNREDRLPQAAQPSQNVQATSVPNVAASAATTQPVQPTSLPPPSSDEVTLLYSPESFTLLNTAGGSLNLNGLNFSSANGQMSISEWDNGYLSRPLVDFPGGDCLQAWPITATDYPAKHASCNYRHAYLRVTDYRQFWRDADVFSVSRSGQVIATCRISAGQCSFNLP